MTENYLYKGVQLRAVSLNIAFLAVTRTTQALDTTGTAAAVNYR
jgi:hypothetical protein